MPRIYEYFIAPLLSRHYQKIHFGQIVPVEDAENILDRVSSIIRLPCICRKVTTGREKRFCYAVGLDLTSTMKEAPDFCDFDRVTVEEAKKAIRALDEQGNTHSVWTFQTPFIGSLCNCDRDCVAYRVQERMALGKVMWKAEYVAGIDPLLCNGCKECLDRCYFKAIAYDRANKKCSVRLPRCYGCGLCRNVCPQAAVALYDRAGVPQAAAVW
ncbi:MAG: hypothetical protein L3J03_08430 [Desulfobacterales bacterium]|nr:hypothetical protein [Desulfobacterales bacterium]